MTEIDPKQSTRELLQLAADNHHQKLALTTAERDILIALLKERGRNELEYGEELELDNVRLIRRVTGAVGIYFS